MLLKTKYGLLTVFIVVVLIVSMSIYSITLDTDSVKPVEKDNLVRVTDHPSILPDWEDGEYHDYTATTKKINFYNQKYPDIVKIKSIGKSVEGKDIWCIVLTNESVSRDKYSCLIDGCIHGNEWEAGEACLYLAEYLLINYGKNSTITNMLDNSEIYIVPLMNPDGRDDNTRWNENGIDLNRNFDIDFGRLRGSAVPIGKLFGRIKIPQVRIPLYGYLNNCGRKPFSEPESQAIKDITEIISNNDFSFYVNCHTAIHTFGIPWSALKPPFYITEKQKNIFNIVQDWVDINTEYEKDPLSYSASGTLTDWIFMEYQIPSFTFEMLSKEYEPWNTGGKHDNLVHWMKTTLPVFMYLLVNIENLYNWDNPDVQPLLPEGVPPNPI